MSELRGRLPRSVGYCDRVQPIKRVWARQNRKRMTPGERILWQHVRGKALGVKFHRQKPLLGWIVDFWCPACSLVVEVDGGYHADPDRVAHDQVRDRAMRKIGIRVLRLDTEMVERDVARALSMIRTAMLKKVDL